VRSFGKLLGRLILVGIILFGLSQILPPEPVIRSGPVTADLSDPAAALAAREASFDDIRPENEARIVWAGEAGARSDLVVIYLHGFSASRMETAPLAQEVATALNANLIEMRLSGHGRDGDAMAEPRAGDWVDDAAFAMALGRQIGERVVLIGTSTGGTLATYAATEPDIAEGLAGVVLISPNFRIANPAGFLLEWPYARHWVPVILGHTRSFEPQNDGHAAHWTHSYPTTATVTMATLMRETRARDLTAVTLPLLALFSDGDQVVNAATTREVLAAWGGPLTLSQQDLPPEGADPNEHVIAGDILSPAMTARLAAEIIAWATSSL
jgi:alpha-beta hydrolase superfamily lysophospholipase